MFESWCKFIKDNLDETDLEWFRGTQFGILLDVPTHYKHASQLLWSLVLRMANCNREHELWMVVNNVPLRYSLMEYALITGLNCSSMPDTGSVQVTNAFKQRHWPQHKVVSLTDVVSRMKSIEAPYGDEKKKMALLVFVVGVLMCNDKRIASIDQAYLDLVEDIKSFDQYPWGRVSFKYSVRQFQKDLRSKVGSKGATFKFNGFVHPLQVPTNIFI